MVEGKKRQALQKLFLSIAVFPTRETKHEKIMPMYRMCTHQGESFAYVTRHGLDGVCQGIAN